MSAARPDLVVSYRASPDPQDLAIQVTVAGPPQIPVAHFAMRTIVDAINYGAAGGSLFHPTLSAAECLSGPFDAPPTGTHYSPPSLRYAWVVRVAAVAPVFMRTVVEELAICGAEQPVTSMRVVGSLPLDQGPLSVRDEQVLSFIADPTAYVDDWPSPGFPVEAGDRGADDVEGSLRIELADPITAAVRESLEQVAFTWINVVHLYIDNHGRKILFNPQKTLPRFGQSKTEFRAYYPDFRWVSGPSRAAMSNMLSRFHHTVAPIVAAEIGA